MEDGAILNMVKDAFCHRCFIIDFVIGNDDSTMWVVLKHPSRGARGQVLKSSQTKIDEEIPVPSFLAYLCHGVKFVAKHIFSILNYGKSQRCGCTKADALGLNKDWEYMIKNNINKSLEEL